MPKRSLTPALGTPEYTDHRGEPHHAKTPDR